MAGTTLRRFIAFSTLLTLIPALILTALLEAASLLFSKLLHLPVMPSFVVSMIFTSPVLGKFALAARHGDLDSGFFSNWNGQELFGFVSRYSALCVAWGIAVSLIGQAVLAGAPAITPNMMGFATARTAMFVLGVLALVVIALVAATLTVIVAVRSESIAECFAAETWQWVLGRRQDLPAFYAMLIGGVAVFGAITTPAMLVVTSIGFSIRMQVGLAAAAVTYLLPLIALTVLMGKLSGVFVISEKSPDSAEPSVQSEPLEPDGAPIATSPTPATSVSNSPPVRSPGASPADASSSGAPRQRVAAGRGEPEAAKPTTMDLARAIKQLAAAGEAGLPAAIAEAESLQLKAPRHAGLLAELAKLYLRAGRSAEAIATASQAMSQALSTGAAPVAVACYNAFSAHRKALVLQAPELEQLGRALVVDQKFADAVWCLSSCAKLGGEPIRVQKGMIAAAEMATKAGQLPIAARIYEYVIQYAPGTANAEYCQAALGRIQTKLKKSPV